jgi:hypothetical protein
MAAPFNDALDIDRHPAGPSTGMAHGVPPDLVAELLPIIDIFPSWTPRCFVTRHRARPEAMRDPRPRRENLRTLTSV